MRWRPGLTGCVSPGRLKSSPTLDALGQKAPERGSETWVRLAYSGRTCFPRGHILTLEMSQEAGGVACVPLILP